MSIATFTAQRLPARIARFGKIKPSQYPPYEPVQSVLFICQTDQGDQQHWKTYPALEAQRLKVGQPASLYNRAGLGERPLWEVEVQTTPEPVQTPQVVPNNLGAPAPASTPTVISANAEITIWIENQAELYAQCFDAAQHTLTTREVSEETVRAAASTLFISASRKFNLER